MVRTAVVLSLLLLLHACAEKPSWATKPLSEAGEKTYALRGVIVSRDSISNTVMVRHDRIEGFMEAMTMDFSVRGAAVDTLPPSGQRIEARLHVIDGAYWLTDVKLSAR
jgi:Cu/Ag efflux protein CusF